MNEQQNLDEAYENYRKAEHEFHAAIREAFPVGSMLSYQQGQDNRVAEVQGHTGDRIRMVGTMNVSYSRYWDSSFVSVARGKNDA